MSQSGGKAGEVKGHTPFGYKIEDGRAVVEEAVAVQIRQIFRFYLEGDSLTTAAKKAGVISFHGGVSRMLRNIYYLGNEYYPAIVDRGTFDKAEQERMRRSAALGRIKEPVEQEGDSDSRSVPYKADGADI